MVPLTRHRGLRARSLGVAAALLAAVCVGITGPAASAGVFVQLSGAGSTWEMAAINGWDADVSQSGMDVTYSGVGSAGGLADFAQGVVDFAASDIPYGTVDGGSSNPVPARGYAAVPDLGAGVGLMYNLISGGRRVTNLRLSGAVIAGIFTNQITMWNDPRIAADNPGLTLPATPVIPVVRTDSSGEDLAFTQWMSATQDSSWTAYCQAVGLSPCTPTAAYPVQPGTAMVGQAGDAGVATYVSQAQDGAIGLVAYSYIEALGFPVAQVLNAAGYYTAPAPDNVGLSLLSAQLNSDGSADLSQVYTNPDPRAYELSYYSDLIVPTDSSDGFTTDKGYTLGAYGSYALCQGQQQVPGEGYAPLPVNLVEDGYAQLQKVPGASLPATVSAFLEGCADPTFTSDGTSTLAATDPMPPACDQEGSVQCAPAASEAVATSLALTAVPGTAQVNQPVTLTATVSPLAGPTVLAGYVQFDADGTAIGPPVALDSSGVATTTERFMTTGTHAVSAAFTPADPTSFIASAGTNSVTVTPPYPLGMPLTMTNLPAGTFTFGGGATGTATLTVNGGTATGAMIPVVVSDTRNTYPGWSVLGQVSDFTAAGTDPDVPIPGTDLGWAPTSTSLGDGVLLGATVPPVTPGLGTAGAILAVANGSTGFGTSTLGANLTLVIPPGTPAGSYSAVLTLTADSAPAA